jgi:radical SAM superfamily enzyme YgiQ (UPF0313 family)
MEPLTIAALVGLSPPGVDHTYFDERVERIDFDEPTDLVAIPVETYTAKRAYEIARAYRRRGVRVVLGGYHVTLLPDEAQTFADSIMVGYAESHWAQIVNDVHQGRLRPRYVADPSQPVRFAMPDRSIFGGRNYLKLSCIETGRGCTQRCNFCTITRATGARYHARPIEEIVKDVASVRYRNVFLIDDSIVSRREWAKELFRALIPLKIRWFSQGTISMALDEELLDLMAASGCVGLLIGFESVNAATLRLMNKPVNLKMLHALSEAVEKIHDRGIAIYGTFIFGYDSETIEDIWRTVDRARDLGLFMAAFNHLMPFPGTPLYKTLSADRRVDRNWWLSPDFGFGDVPFRPKNLTSGQLREASIEARRRFYGFRSIADRARNFRGNLNSFTKIAGYFSINWMLRREIEEKIGLPLGNESVSPLEYRDEVALPL